MPHFSCYLPETLLQRLDEQVRKTPRGNRSGIMREALEQLLDSQPTTVRDVFEAAMGEGRHLDTNPMPKKPPPGVIAEDGSAIGGRSRAELFHRATQR